MCRKLWLLFRTAKKQQYLSFLEAGWVHALWICFLEFQLNHYKIKVSVFFHSWNFLKQSHQLSSATAHRLFTVSSKGGGRVEISDSKYLPDVPNGN